MSRFSEISKILKEEPEEWLAYLYGQQLDNLSHLKNTKSRFNGAFLRSLIFFFQVSRFYFTSLFSKKRKVSEIDFYIYAGTANQANSLSSMAASLKERGGALHLNAKKTSSLNGANDVIEFRQLEITLADVFFTVVLFFLKGPNLYKRLKKQDAIRVDKFFNTFCLSYFYLSVFYRLINRYKPKYIIVSNDHNVDCRSLLAVAQYLKVKTVYLQHASVSKLFPALTVDYAFLDGRSALETYYQCETNLKYNLKNTNFPKVFLSGQKKLINITKNNQQKFVGLAINSLDDIVQVISLVDQLVGENIKVCLRWHPGQRKSDVLRIKNTYQKNNNILLSDPKVNTLGDFFSYVYCIVAGNSSIHLEAAVMGISPIYYEISKANIEDYYGYVKHNISKKAATTRNLIAYLKQNTLPKPNSASVQFYSATYNTEWYEKEGLLVAETLINLKAGKPWKTQFGATEYNAANITFNN